MRNSLSTLFVSLGLLLLSGPAGAVGVLVAGDNAVGPLGIKYHRVETRVTDRAAVTRVEQVFRNHTDRVLEAEYLFPLPKGASVSNFALWINGRKTKGELLERERAKAIYQSIVSRMKDPGLLEYLGNDLFRAKVYPVPARGEQRIEIEYQQLLPFTAGVHTFVYPMRTDARSARTLEDFTVTVKLESKTPIKSVYSPTHRVHVGRRDDRHVTAGFEREEAALDQDFVLYYTVSEKDVGVNLLAHNPAGEPGYFMLMISPKSSFAESEIARKHITFVLDTSGSMSGEKMTRARAALTYCLERLRPDDLFNVIRFSSDVEPLARAPLRAKPENVQRALAFVRDLEAAGGTAIHDALRAALAQQGAGTRIIVFITDGRPTIGETEPQRIVKDVSAANQGRGRIFVFGVGDRVNTRLLDRIAAENRGAPTYVRPNEEIESKIARFFDRVRFPVLTDVELDLGRSRAYDVFPRRLPDLFRGDQLLVLGRYRSPGDRAIHLSGRLRDKRVKYDFEGLYPEREGGHDFLPRLWALRKVGYLLEEIRTHGEQAELRDEVIRLAKRFGIVTPYTAYLVTEDADRPVASARPPRRTLHRDERRRAAEERRRGGVHGPATATPSPGFSGGAGSRPDLDLAEGDAKLADGSVMGLRSRASTAPAEKKAKARRRAAMKPEALEAEAGADAVAMSAEIQRMKESRTAGDGAGRVRHVGGRTFRWTSGGWVETNADSRGVKTLEVQYLSEAYFTLLSLRPELGRILSRLGEQVTILVGPKKAVRIGTAGLTKPGSELEAFVR